MRINPMFIVPDRNVPAKNTLFLREMKLVGILKIGSAASKPFRFKVRSVLLVSRMAIGSPLPANLPVADLPEDTADLAASDFGVGTGPFDRSARPVLVHGIV